MIRKQIGKLITQAEFDDYARLRKQWTDAKQNPPQSAQQALVVKESGPEAPVTHVLLRGNPMSEGDLVEPGYPSVLGEEAPQVDRPASGESTGRRRALAEWIASPKNPLTSRVIVNRIWQWHFGRGLVRSSNNFGLQGDRPTHPELLDWLAAELVEQGWSIKALHRLILTSRTYQMASTPNPAALEQDPLNDLLWRFDPRRLRAEEIRDSILAVNDTLNLDRMYGPSIYPELPPEVLAGQSRPGEGWHTSAPDEAARRSVYIHVKRSLQVPLLAAFDMAETDSTCPERFVSTQPTQALGMLNSEFLRKQAALLEASASKAAAGLPDQVAETLRRVMQREPTGDEIDRGLTLIRDLQEQHGLTAGEARRYFSLVALNLNEFVYLD
ncbi:MAG: DUF1553 domain-containing protein [Phycisphaerales bacterium]|nr:DUF1553 domain-containing protein [Phycisphaerales bacterium]